MDLLRVFQALKLRASDEDVAGLFAAFDAQHTGVVPIGMVFDKVSMVYSTPLGATPVRTVFSPIRKGGMRLYTPAKSHVVGSPTTSM